MLYNRELLNADLEIILNKSITGVYYSKSDVFYESDLFVEETSATGVLLEIDNKYYFSITSFDYEPNLGYNGLIFFNNPLGNRSQSPNHLNDHKWKKVLSQKISKFGIIENSYLNNDSKIVIPFGLKFEFENQEKLYIINSCIEKYDKQKKFIK